jgi:hypothetical protein
LAASLADFENQTLVAQNPAVRAGVEVTLQKHKMEKTGSEERLYYRIIRR